MDSPSVAVVLVGLNPTPALLSSLTLPADRIVLLCSDGTRSLAERVAAALERLAPDRSARVMGVGPDPHDPVGVGVALERIHRDHGVAPRHLDYTGGTKVMSVAAALHRAPATGAPGLRCHYLDPTSDLLRPVDAADPALPIADGGVDLGVLADVHGAHWLEDRDPAPVRAALRGGARALRETFPGLHPTEVRGVVNEAEVLRHLRRITRGRGDIEVLGPRRVADPRHPADSIADFDALVRIRHRVLCVEVKSGPEEVVARAGWTVAKARRVFGNVAKVLFVHTGPPVPGLRERISDHSPALSSSNVQAWSLRDLRERLTDAEALRRAFFPGQAGPGSGPHTRTAPPTASSAPSAASFPPRAVPSAPPTAPCAAATAPICAVTATGPAPILVTALGSSRLGLLSAVHAHRPARALLISSRQGVRSGVREAAARALYAAEHPGAPLPDTAGLRESGHRDRIRFAADPVDGFDAGAVADAARAWIDGVRAEDPERPVVVDVTTGTKAMSLGLALAARRSGACIACLVVRDRTVVCLAHGGTAAQGRAVVDWALVLDGYAPLVGPLSDAVCPQGAAQIDVPLVAAAADHLARAASGPVGVWADRSLADPATASTARERSAVVLTFDDRAVGLVAPSWRRPGRSGVVRGVSRGAWAQSVSAATGHLNLRCDVAGKVMALSRPGGDVGRAGELVAWITHDEPDDDGGGDWGFGDPQRPVLVVADPAAPPALWNTDVSVL
ncbi:CRISPR-associated protein [Nocardiopsis lambiniae]|uniref:CRISPR-associated protein n=1 Tax=Nocardiopsis lambiniae TaxID=3075539 RepID=A0ABU2MCS4_9ACTN|nr:CRISPR-associated protein [Nocardiopsis sp. DSM 44743]MDT0330372.1 CRISPR-associated protein [Nocardiopsis sp. DSM 44743]